MLFTYVQSETLESSFFYEHANPVFLVLFVKRAGLHPQYSFGIVLKIHVAIARWIHN